MPILSCSLTFCLALIGWMASEQDIFEGKPIKLLDQGAGEGPAWQPSTGLLFSGDGNVNRFADNRISVYRENVGSNGLLFDSKKRLLICQPRRRRVTRIDQAGNLTVLTESYRGKKYNQPNDLTIDSKGRIYFSDPRYGDRLGMELHDSKGRAIEGVYRIDTNGIVDRIITHEVDRPNGVLVTPNDRRLYVADNNNNTRGGARKLWQFELTEEGRIAPESQKLVFDWKTGRGPDGMALDRSGRLFVAGGRNTSVPVFETSDEFKGGVYVFSPNGVLLDFVAIANDEVTNCSFGGRDLRTLFITAGGTLWSIRTIEPGQLIWSPN